ncbi:hypothetical protein A2U01_0090334 [Trifolium medium]|uniref:Uncharacterized protein n=1 Tax=Trifolium medium TaxID=97028 RepID=A0A392U6F2_9FABA|nr:hypothetical protein [Trifolium medium]
MSFISFFPVDRDDRNNAINSAQKGEGPVVGIWESRADRVSSFQQQEMA